MFARFARAQDASSRVVLAAVLGGAILAAWSAWFFLARVGLFEVSHSARLEVATAPNDVDAPVAARLVRSALVLDRQVQQGEDLVELDAEDLESPLKLAKLLIEANKPKLARERLEQFLKAHADSKEAAELLKTIKP